MQLDLSPTTQAAIRTAQALIEDDDVPAALAIFDELLRAVGNDHLEATAVLHVRALVLDDPAERLWAHEAALQRAELGDLPAEVKATLYANVAGSHHALGHLVDARRWYERALAASAEGGALRAGVEARLARLR